MSVAIDRHSVTEAHSNFLVLLMHESILDFKSLLDRLPLQERIVPPVSPHPDCQSYAPRPGEGRDTHLAVSGKSFSKFNPSTFNLQPGRCSFVPRDERQICDSCLISDEVARGTLGEDRL